MRDTPTRGFKVSDFPANEINDLEIKKRARRRLVGATVLALLAVIVLPLVVKDSEAPRTVPDMQVSIPERGEFELPPVVPENDPEYESARVDIEPDAATGAPEFPAELPSSLPEASPPEQPAPTPPVAQPSREPRQENVPPRSSTATRESEAARALALLDGTASAKEVDRGGKTTAAQGQVFVQVAAFSNADRAAKQAKELKSQGFDAYAERAGKVTRVRIGPLPRSEGEQILARLKAQGRSAVLSSR